MTKEAKLIAEGASCAIDGSCGGETKSEVSQNEASCRLDPPEMSERVARWRTLFGHLLDYRLAPSEAVFQFNNTTDLKSEINELIKLERVCCAQVAWLLDETPEGLALTLEADGEALESFMRACMPAVPPMSGVAGAGEGR